MISYCCLHLQPLPRPLTTASLCLSFLILPSFPSLTSPTSPGIPAHPSQRCIPQVTRSFSLSPSRFLNSAQVKAVKFLKETKVEETQQCAVNANSRAVRVFTRVARADARPLGRKRSMIETIMHLSVFLLTLTLARCFGTRRTHTSSHVRQLISHTFSSTPSCSCLLDGLSVSHFHCSVVGSLLWRCLSVC